MEELGDYKINYEPLFGPLQLIDVGEAIKRADHPWYNQTLIEVGGVLLRLGVFAGGEYHWHKHQEQDEFFYVIDGRLRIELEGRDQWNWLPVWHSRFRAGCCIVRWHLSPRRC
jgi:oxalate decarboxylase/phosphoglucose isomerase-like protein (cupin superfamily)